MLTIVSYLRTGTKMLIIRGRLLNWAINIFWLLLYLKVSFYLSEQVSGMSKLAFLCFPKSSNRWAVLNAKLSLEYDGWLFDCHIFSTHVWRKIAKKVNGWQVFICGKNCSSVSALKNYSTFQGHVLSCTCLEPSRNVSFSKTIVAKESGWGELPFPTKFI